jgi:hypothetical protein
MSTATVVTGNKRTSDTLQKKGFKLLGQSAKNHYYLQIEDDTNLSALLAGTNAVHLSNEEIQRIIQEHYGGWGGQEDYKIEDLLVKIEEDDTLSALMAGLSVKGGGSSKSHKTKGKSRKAKGKKRTNNSRRR